MNINETETLLLGLATSLEARAAHAVEAAIMKLNALPGCPPTRHDRNLPGHTLFAREFVARTSRQREEAAVEAARGGWEPALQFASTIRELMPLVTAGIFAPADAIRAAIASRDACRHEHREDVRCAKKVKATDRLSDATRSVGEATERGLYAVAEAILLAAEMGAAATKTAAKMSPGHMTGSGL